MDNKLLKCQQVSEIPSCSRYLYSRLPVETVLCGLEASVYRYVYCCCVCTYQLSQEYGLICIHCYTTRQCHCVGEVFHIACSILLQMVNSSPSVLDALSSKLTVTMWARELMCPVTVCEVSSPPHGCGICYSNRGILCSERREKQKQACHHQEWLFRCFHLSALYMLFPLCRTELYVWHSLSLRDAIERLTHMAGDLSGDTLTRFAENPTDSMIDCPGQNAVILMFFRKVPVMGGVFQLTPATKLKVCAPLQ